MPGTSASGSFVAADAFTATARSKIEGAGGFVQVLAPATAKAATAAPAMAEPATAESAMAEPAITPEPTAEDDSQATE